MRAPSLVSLGRKTSSSLLSLAVFKTNGTVLLTTVHLSTKHFGQQRRMTHLEKTAEQTRTRMDWTPARIVTREPLNTLVQYLKLELPTDRSSPTENEKPCSNEDEGPAACLHNFKAGQWVDMRIPGVDVIGGYSMVSSPGKLRAENVIELAVKRANHPPAQWIHSRSCQVGNSVEIRFGGDWYFDPDSDRSNLLLLAGGVGINPLLSIIRQTLEHSDPDRSLTLLYSVTAWEDAIFMNDLRALCRTHPHFTFKLFITQETVQNTLNRRISPDDIRNELAILENVTDYRSDILCYLCGPPGFLQAMKDHLASVDFSTENVKFESWS